MLDLFHLDLVQVIVLAGVGLGLVGIVVCSVLLLAAPTRQQQTNRPPPGPNRDRVARRPRRP